MKLKISALVALALASSGSLGAAEKLTTSTINVYSATPLPSLGLPLNIIPANIQIATPKAINAQSGVSLADYMSTNMQSVSVTEMGGNPWQPEVTFRGYSASPLLGMPQGMSTYVDGVRVNEPFGDVTLWDKIPNFAIGGMQLVPGSNPMYGLNTLGGAIAIQTKSGRQAQGVGIEAEYGSWNRQRALVEYGGVSKDGSMDFYIGHQTTKEDGWRQFSPSHLNQTFAKTGWQSEKTKLDLSYIGTDNKLIGNGFTPEHMLSGDRDQIHTRPDWSNNYYHHLALNGSHWVNNDVMLSGNAYYRKSNRHTKNGDLYESEMAHGGTHEIYGSRITCAGEDEDACELKGSALNTTHTKQDNYGLAGQVAFNQDFMGKKNQFIVGTGFDYSLIRFKQNERVNISSESEAETITVGGVPITEPTVFDSSREPLLAGAGLLPQTQTTGLTGKQWTASLFATDTLSLNDKWHVNAGVRYNHTKVDNDDTLRGSLAQSPRSLTAVDDYKRLNPTIGITHTPTDRLSVFGTYSESSRAPTSIELGCSNPDYGCLLPSAMADDPPLKQVVAKTYDFGARGSLTDEVKWNASIYHAMNHQDLQFIRAGNSTSRGYYNNVGRTQRQGLDLGLSGQHDQFKWSTSYSYIRATFDSDFSLVNSSNSSAPNVDPNKNIYNVTKGDKMPSIPAHQFKARAQYDVTPKWSVGTNIVYFSDQFVIGNENNEHQANTANCLGASGTLRDNKAACGSGKISDYTVVNLDTQYNFGGGWKAFAKAINIFDNDYYVAGRLAETMFDASGAYNNEIKSRGVIPGAPRAAWIGMRYEFGGAPEAK
ncbi:TonB-dependent receptor [Candidatus Methylopumilus universalis]|uniref:TonB-dependent receptor n=1 Tax=Candidatus Methylopumilus universalis TaxID=2588536 RepID=UPI0011210E80|nr:TonB-dependent receptor [Candidatus Methylopumilus universalis]QDC47570.1 TonB-dependent receptor [Candidatus Methylopumilus universalis]QDC72095.1 TonB-dependent receptor [Candidatus Methylopumilus universalis]